MAISAAPLSPKEEELARETRASFTRAAGGQDQAAKHDKPEMAHNIEPPIQEKKAAAALDSRSEGRDRFERIKDTLAARSAERGHERSL